MSSDRHPPACCSHNSILSLCKRMSPVDSSQCLIIRTFNAIFYPYESPFIQFFQIVQQIIGHTVRSCSYDQPHHISHSQCLFILAFQLLQFTVSISISLKISQIFHFRIFPGKEPLSFLQLLSHRLIRMAISRVKRLVIAISTAPITYRTIPIRTSKACINGNLLHLERKVQT